MGTLFNQEPRDTHRVVLADVSVQIEALKHLASNHKVSLGDVIAVQRNLEQARATDAYVANGDAWDEQIAGVGQLLQELNEKLDSIAAALSKLQK